MIDLSSSWENALLKSSASLYVSSNGKAREFCFGLARSKLCTRALSSTFVAVVANMKACALAHNWLI